MHLSQIATWFSVGASFLVGTGGLLLLGWIARGLIKKTTLDIQASTNHVLEKHAEALNATIEDLRGKIKDLTDTVMLQDKRLFLQEIQRGKNDKALEAVQEEVKKLEEIVALSYAALVRLDAPEARQIVELRARFLESRIIAQRDIENFEQLNIATKIFLENCGHHKE